MSGEKVLGVVEALFDFKASDSVGLSFSRGDKIKVYQQAETGWWEGSLPSGQHGWFPSNFTTAIGEEMKAKWIEQTNSSGNVFYYNVMTGESVWEIPKDDDIAEDDRRNSILNSGQNDRPAPELNLPEGWSMHETNDGKTFYFNKTTKQASWTFPAVDASGSASCTAQPAGLSSSTTAPSSEAALPSSNGKPSDKNQLPKNWFVKQLPGGRQYYYNSVTNETVWSVEEISQAKLSADTIIAVNNAAALKTQASIDAFDRLISDGHVTKDPTWSGMIQQISKAFSKLNESAKTNSKSAFVENTKAVLSSIREMLIASGAYDPTSQALMKNKTLQLHHKGLTDNLAKLVLAAKLASGVWPPPDSIVKMQSISNEILISLRLFVTTAAESGISINMELVSSFKSTQAKLPPKIIHPKPKLSQSSQNNAPPVYYRRTVAPSIPQRFPISGPAQGSPVVPPSSKKPINFASPPGVPPHVRPRTESAPTVIATPPPAISAAASVPVPIPALPSAPTPAATQSEAIATPALPITPAHHASSAPVHSSPLAQQAAAAQEQPQPEPDEIEKAIIQEEEALQAQAEAAGIDDQEDDDSGQTSEVTGEDSSTGEDAQRIARLDNCSKEVLLSVEAIVMHVKKTGFGKTVGDQKLVTLASDVVANVGSVLEIADEIEDQFAHLQFDVTLFQQTKTALFETISGLVGTARQAVDPLAPSDAIKQVMMGVQSTVNAVHQLVISCKQLIEFKENAEHDMLRETLGDFGSSGSSGTNSPVPHGGVGGINYPPGYTAKRSMSLAAIHTTPVKPSPIVVETVILKTDDNIPGPTSAPIFGSPLRVAEQVEISKPTTNSLSFISSTTMSSSAPTLTGAPEHMTQSSDSTLRRTASQALATSSLLLDEETETVRRRTSSKLVTFYGAEVDAANQRNKLASFFGGAGVHDDSHHNAANKKKAFLGVDYKPDDLAINMEGKVRGGTLAAMVERMTQHDVVDTEFMLAFLLTYRSFTSPRNLLDLLIARYNLQPAMELSSDDLKLFNMKKLTPIRLRVINVIKLWVENYFDDFKDDQLLQKLQKFIKEEIQTVLKNPADHLQKLLQKKTMGTVNRKMVFSGKAPLPVLGKNLKAGKFSITDLEPLEVARQLSLMESKLYNSIQANECLNKAWSDAKTTGGAENIRAMIERSNQFTAWVASTILNEDAVATRVKVLRHFILIGEKCRSLNNFNSLMAILAAFNSAPVHRLKRSWAGLSAKERKQMENLKALMDSTGNFSVYRKTLHSIQPPCVPFLGVYLTDLTFIEDGNKDMLNVEKQLINFDKRLKVAIVIREIQQYQSAQYCLQPVDLIEQYLLNKFKTVQPIEELYDLSLKIEPRESTDDTVLRLLAESGFL